MSTTTAASDSKNSASSSWWNREVDVEELLAALLTLTWRALRALVRFCRWHPILAALTGTSMVVGLLAGPVLLAGASIATGLGLVVWGWRWPVSFRAGPVRCLRSGWRREWVYARRWRNAMYLSGLGANFAGQSVFGQLGRVRSNRYSDIVTVRMSLGQETPDWERRLMRLAHSFAAEDCRVLNQRPGRLDLRFQTKDPLAKVVAPLPVIPADRVDLTAVPVGITEDGDPWCLRILGSQTLIGGRPGSGKSSVIWALLHSLGDAIHQGIVEVWAVDPKGGIELAAAEPLFTRYAHPQMTGDDVTAESVLPMVELLEDAARLVMRRADSLRGTARKIHTPTRVAPAVIVIVDELLYLTTLLPDDPRLQLKRRVVTSMGIIASQGRAPAVSLLGGLQDVRKEAVVWRDLIDERVALAMVEASQTDLVLGPGARDAGARCELIPKHLAGVGYVRRDRDLIRVRAAWHDDRRNNWLAANYPAPGPLDVLDTDAREGHVYTLTDHREGAA